MKIITNRYANRLTYIQKTIKLKNIKNIKEHHMNITEHKTDMNITKTDQYKTATTATTTEQRFYEGAQNRHNITKKLSSTFTKVH